MLARAYPAVSTLEAPRKTRAVTVLCDYSSHLVIQLLHKVTPGMRKVHGARLKQQ